MLNQFKKQLLAGMTIACLIVVQAGCIGTAAQLLYVLYGHKAKAAYSGLEGKKVAVVCVSDDSAYGPDSLTYTVNKAVSVNLAKSVKRITVIPPTSIENWRDVNGWNKADFVEVGRGVKADMVVAIEIGSYTLRDGKTMLKGQTNFTVTVYDIKKGGDVAFVYGPTNYVFPRDGRSILETDERTFEKTYLAKLTDHVARLFYDSDALDNVADSAMNF